MTLLKRPEREGEGKKDRSEKACLAFNRGKGGGAIKFRYWRRGKWAFFISS